MTNGGASQIVPIRSWLILVCSAPLACSVAPPPPDVAVEAESTDSTDATESAETTDSREFTRAVESTESTDESTDDSMDFLSDTDWIPDVLPPPDLPPINPNEDIPPLDEEGCPGIYAQDLLPTFDLVLDPEVWALLQEDWLDGPKNYADQKEYNPKRPVEAFVYQDIVILDAVARVRGNPVFWDADDKIQLAIDFNEVDPNGRFLGLRQVALDHATANKHLLRDRLALWIMRDMGIIAPCANHARLNVNDEYYGVFVNLEKLDKSFLERNFQDPEGDLWDRHDWELKTNEGTSNDDRLNLLLKAESLAELEAYLDVDKALQVFAAEAIIPNGDGPWAGGYNFFVYDDPIGGKFLMLPWDLDATFERFHGAADDDYPTNPDPVTWEKPTSHGRPWYDLALADADRFDDYIEAIEDQYESSYDADDLHDLIDEWTDQISDSVLEDDNKPYSDNDYWDAVDELHDYIDDRYDFLDDWL
jgi:hypothetical protein